MDDVRATLERLIREQGEDYASLSRLLGRNAAYVQQFIHRGTPRKLDEADRRTLARFLGVDEQVLGGPAPAGAMPGRRSTGVAANLVLIPRLAIAASAGPGALVGEEAAQAHIGFDPRWLRTLGANPQALSAIRVDGDSMAPTLNDGDDILVDRGDAADRVRDGVYVLRVDGALLVKRLAVNPAARRISIRSDNPAYPDWEDCDPAGIDVIGRVVWTGRRLS